MLFKIKYWFKSNFLFHTTLFYTYFYFHSANPIKVQPLLGSNFIDKNEVYKFLKSSTHRFAK